MATVMLGLPRTRGEGRTPAPTGRPEDSRLIDTYGRVATDLRVSLTDKCSLRCGYCMPPEGLDWLPDDQVLSDDELIRLITLAVHELGVEEVRFTGGEPLLRRGLERIVEATAHLRTKTGRAPVTALTTNGVGLDKRARALAAAGLNRINVSLDTLDPERFHRITRRDRHRDVLAGLAAAAAAGLGPVKVNTVLLPGINDDEAVPLVRWALAQGYELRFIEQMPLDAQGAWQREQMVTAHDIQQALAGEFELIPVDARARGASPAQTWTATDGRNTGTVGIIASVTRPFCGDCDRTRLTADGQIRNCLFARDETDLRALLRSGADNAELAQIWRAAMWGKAAGHGINDTSFIQPDRPMSAIGG
ncbi:GTP 3',8-cyclase MoaA [Kineosporia mesophila]|uniref:GTP 3',8-cyclase MoaA n=1 Tax=Kineosporia mesophila TaxID=566012 RepID=UPI001E39FB06|nr:GTP 3',8-cyclase MoaA [Kineosporia mesophila]